MMYFIHALLIGTLGWLTLILGYIWGVAVSGFETGQFLAKKHENVVLDRLKKKNE